MCLHHHQSCSDEDGSKRLEHDRSTKTLQIKCLEVQYLYKHWNTHCFKTSIHTCGTEGAYHAALHTSWILPGTPGLLCDSCPDSHTPPTKRCRVTPGSPRSPALACTCKCQLARGRSLPDEHTQCALIKRLQQFVTTQSMIQVSNIQIGSRGQHSEGRCDSSCPLWIWSRRAPTVLWGGSPFLPGGRFAVSILYTWSNKHPWAKDSVV